MPSEKKVGVQHLFAACVHHLNFSTSWHILTIFDSNIIPPVFIVTCFRSGFLLWLFFEPWRCKWNTSPKRQLTLNRFHDVIPKDKTLHNRRSENFKSWLFESLQLAISAWRTPEFTLGNCISVTSYNVVIWWKFGVTDLSKYAGFVEVPCIIMSRIRWL
jgi:hypothetical protein